IENHTVNELDNYSAAALDALTTVDNASSTQAAVAAWIRPLKQDAGEGLDGFGEEYNDRPDWDDKLLGTESRLPAMYGCAVGAPVDNSTDNLDNFTYPTYFE